MEYLKENLWTFRRKIGTFKRLKIDAGLEHLEEISLINLELMVPTDSHILVDDFRHQNFGIWTILGRVMAILVKIMCKIIDLLCK